MVAGQYTLKIKGIEFCIIGEDGKFNYNKEKIDDLKKLLAEEKTSFEDLGLPDLEQFIDQEEKEQKDENEQEQNENNDVEEKNTEKDDKKPKLEDKEDKDEKKEKLAKQYGVSSSQVIHISKNKKITKDNFGQIAKWSKDYDDIYILPGKDEYSKEFIGVKDGKQEKIENAQQQVGGKHPDILIKKVGAREITEVKPLAMYKLDNKSAIAVIRDQHGKPEALYCRQEGGDKKTYWGSVIPEASGKNVYQQGPEAREFMDYRNNSGNDLSKKAKALERQGDLEYRGLPSKDKGVQVEEIEGTQKQNREINVEDIKKYLMSRDGIIDEISTPPGYYEHKAEEVLYIMENDEDIQFDDAVERVEAKGEREKGGMTPGEGIIDRRKG